MLSAANCESCQLMLPHDTASPPHKAVESKYEDRATGRDRRAAGVSPLIIGHQARIAHDNTP